MSNPILDPDAIPAPTPRPASTPVYGGVRDGGAVAILVTLAAQAAASAISRGGSDEVGAAVGQLITEIGPIAIGMAAGLISGLFTYIRKRLADRSAAK